MGRKRKRTAAPVFTRNTGRTNRHLVAGNVATSGGEIEDTSENCSLEIATGGSQTCGRRLGQKRIRVEDVQESSPDVALAKTKKDGEVHIVEQDHEINIDIKKNSNSRICRDYADGGKISRKSTGGSFKLTVGASQSLGGTEQASQHHEESVNTRSARPTRVSGRSRDSKDEDIYITVRDFTTRNTEKLKVRSSDKVEIMWEKLGVSKGKKKFFDSNNKELVEEMTFRENGVKSNDVIRADEGQEVVARSACHGNRRIR